MTDKVLLLRSQLPKTDSRLQRYLQVLSKHDKGYIVIGWDKNNTEKIIANEILYKKITKIGGGMRNIISLMYWNLFLFRQLIKLRKNYSVIHAVDFDTIMPGLFVSKIFNKRLIFDVYDKYTASRKMPKLISFFIDKIEYMGCKYSDKLILPDECRRKQLSLSNNISSIVIENVPQDIEIDSIARSNKNNNQLILSYVGILEQQHRGLEDLLSVVSKTPSFFLNIAGDGALVNLVVEYSKKYNNIVYHGAVLPEKALTIMASSHIIVGMYYKTIPNHLFASPNKYYEHLLLGKALLTTKDTPPGDKVEKFGTGYAIEEGEEALMKFSDVISIDDAIDAGARARTLWDNCYKNYTLENLEQLYLQIVL